MGQTNLLEESFCTLCEDVSLSFLIYLRDIVIGLTKS